MEKTFSERVAEATAAVNAISPAEANQQQFSDPNTIFIDPRDISDITSTTGIIPGALNVALNTLVESTDEELPEALSSRSRPIITACQAGPMGAIAAHALMQRGFTNVVFMDGGTQGWLDAGYSTTRR